MRTGRPRLLETTTVCPDCGGHKYRYANFCNNCKGKGTRNSMYGRQHSAESKLLMSINAFPSMKGKFGPSNPSWNANATRDDTGRERAQRWFTLKPCIVCGSKAERHHIDENPLNNNAENIAFLCRRHHKHVHHGHIVLTSGNSYEYTKSVPARPDPTRVTGECDSDTAS